MPAFRPASFFSSRWQASHMVASVYWAAESALQPGALHQVMPWSDPVRNRHVVVVEEIVDSGNTLARLLADLAAEQPASLKVCTLIDKTGRRETPVPVHYSGFVLEDGFVIGYGLDYDQRYRNLPDIHLLGEDELTT